MDEVDQQYLNELVQSTCQPDEDISKATDVKIKDDGTTIDEIQVILFVFYCNTCYDIGLWTEHQLILQSLNILVM